MAIEVWYDSRTSRRSRKPMIIPGAGHGYQALAICAELFVYRHLDRFCPCSEKSVSHCNAFSLDFESTSSQVSCPRISDQIYQKTISVDN